MEDGDPTFLDKGGINCVTPLDSRIEGLGVKEPEVERVSEPGNAVPRNVSVEIFGESFTENF